MSQVLRQLLIQTRALKMGPQGTGCLSLKAENPASQHPTSLPKSPLSREQRPSFKDGLQLRRHR